MKLLTQNTTKSYGWPLLVMAALAADLHAQESQTETNQHLKWSGYLETYYLHDFNDNNTGERPGFTYSHHQSERPSVNLAMLKAAFQSEQLRANLALGSGTYMRQNYAAEPDKLQKLLEANIGFKLSDTQDVWLDVGLMPSHIGFESAIGAENWTLTRSVLADNSPYFETGARIAYTSPNGKWYASGLVLNGWQRIQRPEGNTAPALGHQLTYKPNTKITLNSSSFIGNNQSDRQRKMRYFHHFYGQYQLSDQLSLLAGFDIGAEQKQRNSNRYNIWLSPIVMAKYVYSDALSFALRAEYYQDKDGVIVDLGTQNGFEVWSYSANLDIKLSKNVLLRTEIRQYQGTDQYFIGNNKTSRNNTTATTALAIYF